MPYDERKGDDSDASTSQKMPKITGRSRQKIEKAMKDTLLWASEGTWPGDTSILYFQLQNSETRNFCCFKPLSLWYFVTAALRNEYTKDNRKDILEIQITKVLDTDFKRVLPNILKERLRICQKL